MYRYIALVWNEEDAAAVRAAKSLINKFTKEPTPWKTVYNNHGLIVLQTGENKGRMQAYALENGAGVILGKLFRKSPCGDHSSIDKTLSEDVSQKTIATEGKHLVEHYWGRYVAFLSNNQSHKKSVLKSPVEGFNCNYIHYRGVTVYFSFLEDILSLNIHDLSFNWHHIRRHVKYFLLNKPDTAFNELFKLQGGECRQHGQDEISSIFHWDPVKIACGAENIEDLMEAARMLRQQVVGCVSAWAAGYDKILHTLSGGLDSSIILAGLMECRDPEDVTCINYFPKSDKSGDERYFARLIAKHYGVELIERELDPAHVKMEKLFDISLSWTPELYLTFLDRCPYELQLAHEVGAEVLFNGEGGDAIFFQSPTHFAASDYFQLHGLTTGFFRVALNTARLMKKSIGYVLYNAVKDRATNLNLNKLNVFSLEDSNVLNSKNMQNIDYTDTLDSRLRAANDLPYGKKYYIALTDMPNAYHHSGNASAFLENCSPLLSQPIIEFCLRIPSYVFTAEGKDRGLARMAFKDDLPREILRRESKGGISNYVQNILKNNMGFIKENLMRGTLVKENLLDQDGLKRILTSPQASVDIEFVNILRHICTEIWLRKILEEKYKNASAP